MLSAEVLMKQACMTAHDYMVSAKHDIDKVFGDGYAASHPELVAAYMQTAATDFLATFGCQEISTSIDGLRDYLVPG